MKQMSLATGFEKKSKRTRKREFLDEMDLVVPWHELVTLIESHSPPKATGRPAFAVESMLRIHLLQQWFNLSDPAVEEALYDTPVFASFARPDPGISTMPDESTILRFCGGGKQPRDQAFHGAQRPAQGSSSGEPSVVAQREVRTKASTRAKVEHPLRVIKQQFGFNKVR